MTSDQLRIQLEKTENELKKNEEKKKDLLGKKTEAKKASKVLTIIKDNFGEIDESNLELFQKVMEGQSKEILKQKELLEQGTTSGF